MDKEVNKYENSLRFLPVGISIALLFLLFSSVYSTSMPEFSHTRGFYYTPFYLTLSTTSSTAHIHYTTDCTKPDKQNGILYTEPILISGMTTIRAVAYEDTSLCSKVRTHSFIFPADVLIQDNSGVPVEQNSHDHVFWTEEFDMNDVTCSEEEMIDALNDLPTVFISLPYDSMFGISGIHRGQNLEEYGGDPHDPTWREEVECSVEMIYPEDYRDGQYKNWQENCGIKIQGGASRWSNGELDHKQSFTLEFKSKYGAGKLKNNILASAPFNRESAPSEFDKIILRTGFNRDFGSEWDRANYAYTRDQFARDLEIMMTGYGSHGTYAHLYINGKYWGITNPCERMDNDAMAIYFGGTGDDYFYGKGKEGVRFGRDGRYNYLISTDWTMRQLSEIEQYLAVDKYIDLALIHCYANAGDSPQYYFAGRLYPVGPIYYFGWDLEDSFDGGARRSGAPVSMENYNMPYSKDKFEAYFKMKNNIDFRMRFIDRVYKNCFNDGLLTDNRITTIWDSSCNVIAKAMYCEIARWGDERGAVYDHQHWENECNDVRNDLQGRAALLVNEIKKSGMYPHIDPPVFQDGEQIIQTHIYNCPQDFSLKINYLFPQPGKIYFTTDGTDPRTWDLSGNISANASRVGGTDTVITISYPTIVKARMKNGNVWSALHEIKLLPQNSSNLVITEINYDSDSNFDTEDWVEIYNNGDMDIPLQGWSLKDSNNSHIYRFSEQSIIESNSYMVVCNDTSAFNSFYLDVDNVVGNFDFKLGNDGDIVRLFDPQNNLIDSVQYDNQAPWPRAAAGKGSTLELIDPGYDNSVPDNWQASRLHGTPGGDQNSTPAITAIPDLELNHNPEESKLFQNFPNPFNPTTHMNYRVSSAGFVSLIIYNLAGEKVVTLVDEYKSPGEYSILWTAQNLAGGIYFCRLKTGNYSAVKKLILLK